MEIIFVLIYIFCGFVLGFVFFFRPNKKNDRRYVVNSGGQDQLVPFLHEIMADQIPFSKATFTRATYITALKHLRKEIDEVIAADELPFTDPNNGSLMEYADCFILLLDSFWRRHPEFSNGDKLLVAVWNKIQINKRRQWQPPNAEGFVEHVRDIIKKPDDSDLDKCCNLCTTPISCFSLKLCAFAQK